MSRRGQPRKVARQAPFRKPKPRILVVCEGTVTEPQYLDGFVRSCENPRVKVVVDGTHGVPKTLVEAAKKRRKGAENDAKQQKDDNLIYDEVWVVFDVDDHPNIPEALETARQSGIKVAMSNPSFELWLLLHFRGDPGMQGRMKSRAMLEAYLPGYDKHVDYSKCVPGYSEAVGRAMRLDTLAKSCGEPGKNPTTGVYRLTESIRVNDDDEDDKKQPDRPLVPAPSE